MSDREFISRDAVIECCNSAKAGAEKHYGVAEGVGAHMALNRILALPVLQDDALDGTGLSSVNELLDTLISTMASLAAAISLLERAPATIAPSNKMFELMKLDYAKSLDDARMIAKKYYKESSDGR